MLIAQISDCHIVECGSVFSGRVDTGAALEYAVGALNTSSPRPDLVVATGDLVNDARPAQYERLATILGDLEIPLVVIPGNHDDRALMRAHLGAYLPTPVIECRRDCDPIHYRVELDGLGLIALDTVVPGEPFGHIERAQLDWLHDELADDPQYPTVIAMHHPPFTTGLTWMDGVGLTNADELAHILVAFPNVIAVLCGHVHRPITTCFAGTLASCAPSTAMQLALALDGARYGYSDEPGAIALHRFEPESGLVTHLTPIPRPSVWIPDWALDTDQS